MLLEWGTPMSKPLLELPSATSCWPKVERSSTTGYNTFPDR